MKAVHNVGGPAHGADAISAVLESQSDYLRCAAAFLHRGRHTFDSPRPRCLLPMLGLFDLTTSMLKPRASCGNW